MCESTVRLYVYFYIFIYLFVIISVEQIRNQLFCHSLRNIYHLLLLSKQRNYVQGLAVIAFKSYKMRHHYNETHETNYQLKWLRKNQCSRIFRSSIYFDGFEN